MEVLSLNLYSRDISGPVKYGKLDTEMYRYFLKTTLSKTKLRWMEKSHVLDAPRVLSYLTTLCYFILNDVLIMLRSIF